MIDRTEPRSVAAELGDAVSSRCITELADLAGKLEDAGYHVIAEEITHVWRYCDRAAVTVLNQLLRDFPRP